MCDTSLIAQHPSPIRLHRPPSCAWVLIHHNQSLQLSCLPLYQETWQFCHSLLRTDHGLPVVTETCSVWLLRSEGWDALFVRRAKKTEWRTQTVAPHFTFTLPQAHSHILQAHTNKHAHTCILNSFDFSLSAVYCCTVLTSQLSFFILPLVWVWRSSVAVSSPSSTFKNRTWMTKRYEMRTQAAIFSHTGMWGCNWSPLCASHVHLNCLNYQ